MHHRHTPQGEYVWEELDLLLDEQGEPIPGTNQQGAALPQNPWVDAQRGGGAPPGNSLPGMMPGMVQSDHGMPHQQQMHHHHLDQHHHLPQHQQHMHHPMSQLPPPQSAGMMQGGAASHVGGMPDGHLMPMHQQTAYGTNPYAPDSRMPGSAQNTVDYRHQNYHNGMPSHLGGHVVPGAGSLANQPNHMVDSSHYASTGPGVNVESKVQGGILPSSVGPLSSSSPSASTSTSKAGRNGPVDKDAKRRAAVAAASRATRAKRKRELEELKEKNVKLEKERETFLNTIADLQMKVQALRETGSIDLRMENDLLRAELMEHKSFISKFKHIADGIPTTTSAKKLMCKQGSDTAIAQVLGLLSTSMADPSWRIGVIRDHPEFEMRYQRLPHGVSADRAKRCSMRVDIPVFPVKDPIEVAQVLWGVWCDEDLNKRISKHFGAVSVSVREIETGIENGVKEAKDSKAGDSLRNRVKVYYYREETSRHGFDAEAEGKSTDVVDTVLLLSSREKSISRSSFPPDMRFHKFPPDAKAERARLEGKVKPAEPFTLEQQQGLEGQKNYHAIVLASTSTQHSLGLVPVKQGVHRIRSALLEGAVFRKVDNGVAMSLVYSYPSNAEGRIKAHHDALVADDGTLNEQWAKVICEMHDIVLERLPPAIFDAYRKARDQGVPFPKSLENHL
ncbi:Hypothetical Protein FCC1311_099162 [Hondaea fermentalgiana]|uniref:BZIP domain-containing protein n=1 Tax=Hondaea fermentalgiana TaxID=2315210 RepID=A0A2R5GY93_9STRA|nr:Hypothetical Protein FCC1311_099162 [Hondaea fermentalgiana]|eukprot:GBG33693.1 Hypothetical Protein FCC1311_099162 [Hondaea fermentalgiana]